MVTANYEIYVRQEWARANDLTGSIKLSGGTRGIAYRHTGNRTTGGKNVK
jgi:hypothetical protein